ncbi:hypothetical protein HYS92_00600 [Candidatus Daviesbacteria bacterium]|nr:hypothetical protein [Candidatus Daviesbacteria bacterium]
MDFLQIALIFLIMLLSVFLTVTGVQVFLILRDLKKALDKLNGVLKTGQDLAQDIEKPVAAATNLVSSIATGVKEFGGVVRRDSKPKQKRFYKKVL